MDEIEEPLFGGLADGRVFKVGDTVRRPSGDWTPTNHALLEHLRSRGFPAPAPLGLDVRGREMLTFIPGKASTHPWPDALLKTSGAYQVGAMLRAYQRAVVDFAPPPAPIWRHGPQSLEDGEMVLHGDFGPHNLIWSDDRLTGVIDFELARPGAPEEDAVFAVLRVAHLRPDDLAKRIGFKDVPDRRARLQAFAEGYGCHPNDLLEKAEAVQEQEIDRIEGFGGAGLQPWTTFMERDLAKEARLELEWLRENLDTLGN